MTTQWPLTLAFIEGPAGKLAGSGQERGQTAHWATDGGAKLKNLNPAVEAWCEHAMLLQTIEPSG
jgi:hypothetical protein